MMSVRICEDRFWGRDSTPCEAIRKKCQTPTQQNLITYHRLTWLGKICRMQEDKQLAIVMLFGHLPDNSPEADGLRPSTKGLDRLCNGRPIAIVKDT